LHCLTTNWQFADKKCIFGGWLLWLNEAAPSLSYVRTFPRLHLLRLWTPKIFYFFSNLECCCNCQCLGLYINIMATRYYKSVKKISLTFATFCKRKLQEGPGGRNFTSMECDAALKTCLSCGLMDHAAAASITILQAVNICPKCTMRWTKKLLLHSRFWCQDSHLGQRASSLTITKTIPPPQRSAIGGQITPAQTAPSNILILYVLIIRAFRTRPFRRTRTQTEVRN
jgi:hypothetical protein